MLKQTIECGLEGSFKMDLYDAQGYCVKTGEWFSNFITKTGLMYPLNYSFANCFRFLTIGSNTNAWQNNGGADGTNATTGCANPFYTFTVTSDNDATQQQQIGAWMGYEGYETGTSAFGNSTCQTIFEGRGVRFYRAWSVPSGSQGIVVSANQPGGYLNIQEFAVSPSSGGDPIGAAAFSRVTRNLPIPAGYRAVISYQLFVQMKNYGVTPFNSGTFNTTNADTTNDPDLIALFGNLSGFYRQVWPGLQCIDYHGVTFTPKYGCGMEPSVTDLSNYYVYFSPDNAYFDVNASGGGPALSNTGAWQSQGVMSVLPPNLVLDPSVATFPTTPDGWRNLIYVNNIPPNTSVPTLTTPTNIRLGSVSNPLETANLADYTVDISTTDGGNYNLDYQEGLVNASVETVSHATAGTSGINDARSVGQYGIDGKIQKAIFSTRMYRLPLQAQYVTPRKKVISRKAIFAPSNSLGFNSRFGSMVLAYMGSAGSQAGDATLYPLVDTLFYDSSGLCMLQHYRLISGIYLTQRGTGVANCTISIQPQQGNIFRHLARQTFQSSLSGYLPYNEWVNFPGYSYRLGNMFSGWLGTGVPGVGGTSGNFHYQNALYGGCSGWGAVMGVLGDDYNNGTYQYDVGVCEHPTGMQTSEPTGTNPSSLYWPYVHTGPTANDSTNALHVDFSNIVFYKQSDGTLWPDNVSLTPTQLATTSGFCRPTGFILHYDSIGPVGHRLLPHFGEATVDSSINTYYPPSIGGGYPGFSLDNGLEVYFDITWSGDCPAGVLNCS